MDHAPDGAGEPRWQYRILWRYGALILATVGILAMAFGVAGVGSTAVSVTLLPLGFVSLVCGVILPRIEGKFTAGPSGLSAEILAIHQLDPPRFFASGPAIAAIKDSDFATSIEGQSAKSLASGQIKIGDVWDTLDAMGIRKKGYTGSVYFELSGERLLKMPNRGFLDSGIASNELLEILNSWGIKPVASGNYPFPVDANLEVYSKPFGWIQSTPKE